MAKKRNAKVLIVVREGTGRPSRSFADAVDARTPAEIKRLRNAAMKGMKDEHWGWEIGRLFLEGRIEADKFEAGKRWRRLLWAWRQAYGIPAASTKSLSLFAEPKSPPVDPDSEKGRLQAERARELHLELASAHAVLSVYGDETVRSVRHIVEDDCVPIGYEDFNRLYQGLGVLSSLWGLTAQGGKGA